MNDKWMKLMVAELKLAVGVERNNEVWVSEFEMETFIVNFGVHGFE